MASYNAIEKCAKLYYFDTPEMRMGRGIYNLCLN
jgi:hypothetical protein